MITTAAPHIGVFALGHPPHHAVHHGGPPIMCLLILLLAGLAFFLARQGKLGPPPWARGCRRSPEDAALARLAQRFADGDMTPEDYATRVRLIREHNRPGGSPADDLGTPRD